LLGRNHKSHAHENQRPFPSIPDDLIASHAFAECPGAAIKILLAIGRDWMECGCKDNGQLVVTYKMLILATGINNK
jgi:hypothetical protein